MNNRLVFDPFSEDGQGADLEQTFDSIDPLRTNTFDQLDEGDTATVLIDYVMSDDEDATSSSSVSITVTGVNDAPVATADVAETSENKAVTIDVLVNDTDIDGDDHTDNFSLDGASITSTTGLAGSPSAAGEVSITDGKLVFDPGTSFDELDDGDMAHVYVSYSMSDDSGAQSTSTVTITVVGVNDTPIANSDEATTDENSQVLVDVLANDSDVDSDDSSHNFSLDEATILATTGLSSSPDAAGSVSILGHQLLFSTEEETESQETDFVVLPDRASNSFDELDLGDVATVVIGYTMSDDSDASSSSTVTVTVQGLNDTPVAVVDTGTTTENESLTIDVLANDTDIDLDDSASNFTLDEVTILATEGLSGSPSTAGTIRVLQNQLVFEPVTDFDELDEGDVATVWLGYTMSDQHGAQSSASFAISVTGTNDLPVTHDDIAETTENQTVSLDVLRNDVDADCIGHC